MSQPKTLWGYPIVENPDLDLPRPNALIGAWPEQEQAKQQITALQGIDSNLPESLRNEIRREMIRNVNAALAELMADGRAYNVRVRWSEDCSIFTPVMLRLTATAFLAYHRDCRVDEVTDDPILMAGGADVIEQIVGWHKADNPERFVPGTEVDVWFETWHFRKMRDGYVRVG